MTSILIVEGNPQDLISAGAPYYTEAFFAALLTLNPSLSLSRAAPYEAPVTPRDLDGVDGVVFTGSSTRWGTDAPDAACQRRAMEQVFGAGLPSWGSCNGLQLAAVVLGGTVGENTNGFEVGLAQSVTVTEQGAVHPMFAGKRAVFVSPCIHLHEVKRLPPSATLLAGNAHSPVQAVAVQTGGVDFWGTQYHPELTALNIARGLRHMGGDPGLAQMLDHADTDPAVASVLGASPHDLTPEHRLCEMANWLAHVEARKRMPSRPVKAMA